MKVFQKGRFKYELNSYKRNISCKSNDNSYNSHNFFFWFAPYENNLKLFQIQLIFSPFLISLNLPSNFFTMRNG